MSDDTKLSIRTAARMLGISDTALRKAKSHGRCTFNDDGSVDVEKVRLQLAVSTNPLRGGHRHSKDAFTDATQIPKAAPRFMSTIAGVRLRRELADARRAELALSQLEGKLGEREAMTAEFVKHVIGARQLLQAMSSRLASALAAEVHPKKCAALIDEEVRRVCAELSRCDEPAST